MNKLLPLMLAGVMALGSLNAEASRRMGGGKSVGQQSSNVTQREAVRPQAPVAPAQQAAPAAATKPTAAPAPAAAAKKPWGAMLGGLAAGLGLAWLAHSLGFGEAFGNILLVILLAVVAMAVIGMILRKRQGGATPNMAYQGAGASAQEPATFKQYNPANVGNDASARPWEAQPARFDASTSGGSMIGAGLRGPQGWGIPEGFDADGLTNSHAEIAAFQQALLRRSRAVFCCLDATKLGRATPHRVAGWDQLGTLVTDASPAQLAAAGVKLPAARLVPA